MFHDYYAFRKYVEDVASRAQELEEKHGGAGGVDCGPWQRMSEEMVSLFSFKLLLESGVRSWRNASTDVWLVKAAVAIDELLAKNDREISQLSKSARTPGMEVHTALTYHLILNALRNGLISEHMWYEAERPFYTCYPVIFDYVRNVRLDLPWNAVPQACGGKLIFRFPHGHEPFGLAAVQVTERQPYEGRLRVINFCPQTISCRSSSRERIVAPFCFVIDNENGVVVDAAASQHLSEIRELIHGSEKVDDTSTRYRSIADLPFPAHTQYLEEHVDWVTFLLRLYVFTALVRDDPDLLEPLVLAKDKNLFDSSQDVLLRDRLLEKAKRVNGRGFAFGRKAQEEEAQFSRSPHWRNPHPALVWTGEGRQVPRIVFRRGSFVGLEEVLKAPSGYLGFESTEELARIFQADASNQQYVYFLRDGDKPYVKIGHTTRTVQKRLRELSTANIDLRLLAVIRTADSQAMEAQIHGMLRAAHQKNEFFWLSDGECRDLVQQFGGEWVATQEGGT